MTTVNTLINRIDDYASTIEPRRVVIGLIAMPLWLVGFILGLVIRIIWVAGVYLYSAGAVGFQTGFRRKG